MAIVIPIISEFNAKGIKKAVKEFKQLEGAGAKAGFVLKKAMVPATAALGGLAVAAVDFAKAAAEDQLAADQLALALKNNTKATDAQIKANEDFISTLSMSAAVADDELRPALQKLAVGTKDMKKAQDLLQTALNVSAATGVDVVTVSDALAKGYNGNTKALGKLSPQIKKLIKDGGSFADVVKTLDKQFAGASKTAANSAAGGFKKLDIAVGEAKESIGAALLPVVQAVVPYLTKMADWAQKNPGAFKLIAATIAGIAASIMLVNAAMALNPIGLIIIGVGLLIGALVGAYNKFEGFRNVVDSVFGAVRTVLKNTVNFVIDVINKIITGINAVSPFEDIPYLTKIGEVNYPTAGATGNDNFRFAPKVGVMAVPTVAAGAGNRGTTIQVNVNGADPNAVVQTLRRYVRQTGSLPVRTANIG